MAQQKQYKLRLGFEFDERVKTDLEGDLPMYVDWDIEITLFDEHLDTLSYLRDKLRSEPHLKALTPAGVDLLVEMIDRKTGKPLELDFHDTMVVATAMVYRTIVINEGGCQVFLFNQHQGYTGQSVLFDLEDFQEVPVEPQ